MTLTWIVDDYFINHLSLSPEDAYQLNQRYYKDYGLAISGLVKHHKVDPLEYNKKVDDALPLDDIITPNPQLRKLLEDIDKAKVKLWLFTNAHITHGMRVVKLLGVEDMFEGITYCDYSSLPFVCKPHTEMYDKAENEAGAPSSEECYFVGENLPKAILSTFRSSPLLLTCCSQMILTSIVALLMLAAGKLLINSSLKTQSLQSKLEIIKFVIWKNFENVSPNSSPHLSLFSQMSSLQRPNYRIPVKTRCRAVIYYTPSKSN